MRQYTLISVILIIPSIPSTFTSLLMGNTLACMCMHMYIYTCASVLMHIRIHVLHTFWLYDRCLLARAVRQLHLPQHIIYVLHTCTRTPSAVLVIMRCISIAMLQSYAYQSDACVVRTFTVPFITQTHFVLACCACYTLVCMNSTPA
jgi:hypothetical protein